MKKLKFLSVVLCLCMVLSMFVSCDNNNTASGSNEDFNLDNDKYIDEEGEITNIGDPYTMKITPEEIGTLKNNVVTGLETWMDDSRLETTVALREKAYGIDYQYETCTQQNRMARWVTAFVSGDSFDVLYINASEFPIVAQKGLVHPLENIMPVHDEKYFNQATINCFTWKGRVYAANDAQTGIDTFGIFYNDTIFQNSGETTPLELYDSGNWTWSEFERLVTSMHKVNNTADDLYGLSGSYDFIARSAIVSNGGAVIKYTDNGADITLSDPKTTAAIEWTNKIRNYNKESRETFLIGQAAMYIERISQMNTIRNSTKNYEFGWVPFPKGPSGTGEQAGNVDGWAIGKGAKNIAGAVAWIAAGNYYETWAETQDFKIEDTKTEEEIARAKEASKLGRMDNYKGFGISVYNLLEDSKNIGTRSAIEKYSSQFKAKVDDMLGIKTELGAIEFEDIGVIDFNTTDRDYPFVNVIGDDKVAYGTEENQSLKIDLSGMTEFGPIVHTKPELYKIQKGGQYKITFKFLSEKDPGEQNFALVARTTDNLTGGTEFGITWLEPKTGEIYDAEVYINVNDHFDGELAFVLLGSATETNPDMSILIDDFHVELVSNN